MRKSVLLGWLGSGVDSFVQQSIRRLRKERELRSISGRRRPERNRWDGRNRGSKRPKWHRRNRWRWRSLQRHQESKRGSMPGERPVRDLRFPNRY